MVEAARTCASNPHDLKSQSNLRQTVEDLRAATTLVATPTIRKKLISRLETAARSATDAASQCVSSCLGAGRHNSNPQSQVQLKDECEVVQSHIPHLIQAVKQSSSNPDNPSAQLNLINASQQFLQVFIHSLVHLNTLKLKF